jgi:ribosomal protein S18 acetylase RimI-like enzyme
LTSAGGPVGYGEIWEDAAADEAELARLIVDPAARGRGIGRALVRELLAEARGRGWASVWLRVAPDNEPALHAYAAAAFSRASPEEEAAFNEGQPVAYVWLRAPSSQGLGRSRA